MFVHRALDEAAERAPEAVALRWRDVSWRYDRLAEAARGLAATLTGAGVRQGDRVGIHLPKRPEAIASMYGALRAGGAFVALDPLAPAPYVSSLAEDAGITALVTGAELGATWRQWLEKNPLRLVVTVDDPAEGTVPFDQAISTPPGPPIPVADTHLACVYFTSGSTGRPKGVMHSHRALADVARWVVDRVGIGPSDRLAVHPPLHFVLSAYAVFPAPLAGARSVLIPESQTVLGWELVRSIGREGISVWVSAPSALALLRPAELPPSALASLRAVLLSGEAPAASLLREVRAVAPAAALWNLYGTTETWGIAHCRVGDDDLQRGIVPLGSAWEGAEIAVLGEDGASVELGEVGQLSVRSPRLMLGYLNDEEATVRALVSLPADPVGEPAYRTGDFVRVRPDGTFEMAGRKDRQVGRRGQRVDLSEVESALASDPRLTAVAAVAVADPRRGTSITAFVVPSGTPPPSPDDLMDSIGGRVPRRLLPDRIEVVLELPRTSSGKTDLVALEARARSEPR